MEWPRDLHYLKCSWSFRVPSWFSAFLWNRQILKLRQRNKSCCVQRFSKPRVEPKLSFVFRALGFHVLQTSLSFLFLFLFSILYPQVSGVFEHRFRHSNTQDTRFGIWEGGVDFVVCLSACNECIPGVSSWVPVRMPGQARKKQVMENVCKSYDRNNCNVLGPWHIGVFNEW